MPVILITETNPHLVPESLRDKIMDLPILRLWPTDEDQARAIADYASARDDMAIWVVEDRWKNTVYSHYLAEKIVERLQEKAGRRVLLWSHNETIPPASTLRDLGLQSVIFAGVASNALIFANQVNKIWSNESCKPPGCVKPNIFLTDASVDAELLRTHIGQLEGAFVTHPGLIACNKIDPDKELELESIVETGYLARDAAEIAYRLISDAKEKVNIDKPWHRRIFGIESVLDIRREIAREIYRSKEKGTSIPGVRRGDKENSFYEFDRITAVNKHAKFGLWKIQDGQFMDIDMEGIKGGRLETKPCAQ